MSRHIPEGSHAVAPYLHLEDPDAFVAFLTAAFDAEPVMMHRDERGHLVHGEVRVLDTVIELSGAREPWQPSRSAFHIYVPDPDAAYSRALEAGATSLYEVTDHPYGERSGGVKDRWGIQWYIAAVTDPAARQG